MSEQVLVSADYSTSRRPQLRRTLRRTVTWSIALPLAVNVQDYFRQDWYAAPDAHDRNTADQLTMIAAYSPSSPSRRTEQRA